MSLVCLISDLLLVGEEPIGFWHNYDCFTEEPVEIQTKTLEEPITISGGSFIGEEPVIFAQSQFSGNKD